jgi:hypothetical protein
MPPVNTLRRDLAPLGVLAAFMAGGVTLGYLLARIGVDDIESHPAYFYAISTLLAVGLYGSTYGIPRLARRDLRTILLVVTVGVVLKAALVGVLLSLIFHDQLFLLLAVVVAQIDPLSVESFLQDSRMSERAKAVLRSWASFDDPVTVLLTVSLATWLSPRLADSHPGRLEHAMGGMEGITGFFIDVGYNAGLVLVAWLVWRWVVRGRAGLAVLSVVAVATAAVVRFLMLGLAVSGLIMRPETAAWPGYLMRAVRWAFYGSAIALGIVLEGGVDVARGVALGVAAFAAQFVVGLALTNRLPRNDRLHLAVSQQNGITSIVLALVLEPSLPGVVAIIGPAIVTINLLHTAADWAVNNRPTLCGIAQPRPAAGVATSSDHASRSDHETQSAYESRSADALWSDHALRPDHDPETDPPARPFPPAARDDDTPPAAQPPPSPPRLIKQAHVPPPEVPRPRPWD